MAKLDFIAYAEANRDDWFGAMPSDVTDHACAEADMCTTAADTIEALQSALRERDAECERLRGALREVQRVSFSQDGAHRIATAALNPCQTIIGRTKGGG